ncbi:MAG: MFS transporter [Myxococcota bacterium]
MTALVSQAFAVGLTHGIFPVFLQPIEAAFDAPRTTIAAGQVVMMLSLTGSGLLTGHLFDRGHARRIMLGGAMLLAFALVAAARSSGLWTLAGSAALMGMSVPSIGPLSGGTLVTRFFRAERGRALGWIGMGPPLGAGLFAGLAGLLLARVDWRTTLLVFAAGVALVLWPLIWLAVPARFEAAPPMTPASAAESVRGSTSPASPGTASPFRQRVFWLTAGMFALAAGISTGWTAHFVAYLAGQGLAEEQCAALLSAQFWMAVPASFAFGALGDRLGPSRLLLAILALQGLILLLFARSLGSAALPHVVLAGLGVLSGLASGGLIPLFLLLLGRRVEPAVFSRAFSVSNLLMLPVLAGAALVAAGGFERQGHYGGALVILAAGHGLAIGLLVASNRGGASAS